MFAKWDVSVLKMLVFLLKTSFICQTNKINLILTKLNCYTMDTLKLHGQAITLVDQVEDNLLTYFRTKDLRAGDAIPNEMELAAALGVARSAF